MDLPPVKCLACGTEFKPKHSQHRYCRRKCFLAYRYNNEEKVRIAPRFPTYSCGLCGTVVLLNFSPKNAPNKWLNFKCPTCLKTPAEVDLDNLDFIQQIQIRRITVTMSMIIN